MIINYLINYFKVKILLPNICGKTAFSALGWHGWYWYCLGCGITVGMGVGVIVGIVDVMWYG